MTVAWDGLKTILAADVAADDPQITVVFADGFDALTPPFAIAVGLERMTVTAMGGTDDTVWDVTREVNGTPADVSFAGAIVAELRHEYLVSMKNGSTLDLTIIAQTVRHRCGIPGGELEATIEFDTYNLAAYLPDPDCPFVMRSNQSGTMRAYFSGLTARLSFVARDDGGYHVIVVARGYVNTMHWQVYTQVSDPTLIEGVYIDNSAGAWGPYTPIHTVVEHARNELCPYISTDNSHIPDGGQQIGKLTNGYLKSAKEIIDEVTAQGDVGDPLDWAVYTDEEDEQPKLWLYARGRWPIVNIPWGILDPSGKVLPREVPLAWDTENQKTEIIVKFAKGFMPAAAAVSAPVRMAVFDETNTIDDGWSAESLARRMVAEASILQTITESPIVFEYKADDPATKYLTDSVGAEIPLWCFRAGWLGQINGITSPNSHLPITQIQAKTVDVDHNAKTVTVQFGVFDDYAKLVGQFNHQDAKRPDSSVHTPGTSGNVALTPDNLPVSGGLADTAAGLGAGGRVGYDKVEQDADRQDLVLFALWGDPDIPIPTGILPPYWTCPHIQVLGFRLVGGAGAANDPSTATIVIRHGTITDYDTSGSLGATVATLDPSGVRTFVKNLSDKVDDTDPQFEVQQTDVLSAEITANTGFTNLSCVLMYRRLGGAEKPPSSGAPIIQSVSASRDPTNNVLFTTVTDKYCRVQIEFAAGAGFRETGQYTARSARTENYRTVTYLTVPGLPNDLHYRVHVWDDANNETVGDDRVL